MQNETKGTIKFTTFLAHSRSFGTFKWVARARILFEFAFKQIEWTEKQNVFFVYFEIPLQTHWLVENKCHLKLFNRMLTLPHDRR